jgi:hypothetical protein
MRIAQESKLVALSHIWRGTLFSPPTSLAFLPQLCFHASTFHSCQLAPFFEPRISNKLPAADKGFVDH